MKLGKGITGSIVAQGTCSKGGRYLKLGGIGARAAGAGRKDKYKRTKTRVKTWLEKARSLCHHVDKTDLVEEFMDQCEDEIEAAIAELKKRRTLANKNPVEGNQDE